MLSIGCQPNGPRHSRDRLIFETLRKNSCSQRRLYQALCRCDYQSSNVSPYTFTLILCFSWDIPFSVTILFALALRCYLVDCPTQLSTLSTLSTLMARCYLHLRWYFFLEKTAFMQWCWWSWWSHACHSKRPHFHESESCFILTIVRTNIGSNKFVCREKSSRFLTHILDLPIWAI